MEDISSVIENILKTNFSWLVTKNILNTDRLREDLELDSLSMVNLQVSLEDRFIFKFDPIEMDLLKIFSTFGSLVDFISSIQG